MIQPASALPVRHEALISKNDVRVLRAKPAGGGVGGWVDFAEYTMCWTAACLSVLLAQPKEQKRARKDIPPHSRTR